MAGSESPSNSYYQDEVREAVSDFRDQLRKNFQQNERNTSPSVRREYLKMQRFLVRLKYAPILLGDMDSQPLAMR